MREVAVIGVGIHKFGRFEGVSATELGRYAAADALRDASIDWKSIETAFMGSMQGGSGDGIIEQLGLTGIASVHVTNACATGGSAFRLAYHAIASGLHDTALAVGWDKMPPGFLGGTGTGRGAPWWYQAGLGVTVLYFAMRLRRHMEKHGTTEDQLVKVSVKSHRNGALNPNAMYQRAMTYEEIANSRMVCDPLRLFMLCAPNEGAAAAVLCSMDIARRYTTKPIKVAAATLRTRHYGTFETFSLYEPVKEVHDVSWETAHDAYRLAGLGPEDLDVAEIQDTESGGEIIGYEQIGICEVGEGGRLVDEGATEIGGRIPVNTSGGLICCGEPLGASGLRQVHEITLQLRGDAGPRQVPDAKVGFCQTRGAPGISAAIILQR